MIPAPMLTVANPEFQRLVDVRTVYLCSHTDTEDHPNREGKFNPGCPLMPVHMSEARAQLVNEWNRQAS